MDNWKTIEPSVWKPGKSGDNIIGVLVNKEPKDEDSGMSAKYYIENEQGTFFAWGSAILDDRMQYVKIGQKIRITFEGKTKNKRGQDVNLFRVEVSEKQPLQHINIEPAEDQSNQAPVSLESIEDSFGN